MRNTINEGYNLRASTRDKHVYSTFSIQAARKVFGRELSDKATDEELRMCIKKDVWEYLEPSYITKGAIPSRMFLTPKKLPNGDIRAAALIAFVVHTANMVPKVNAVGHFPAHTALSRQRCSSCIWYNCLPATDPGATEQYCSSSWRLLHLAWNNP